MTSLPKCSLQNSCVDNWTWDKTYQSPEIFDKCNQGKIIFPHGYTRLHGTKALDSKKHYWEIKVENSDSSNVVLTGILIAKKMDINCKYDKEKSTKDNKELMRHETAENINQKYEIWMLDNHGGLMKHNRGHHDHKPNFTEPFPEQPKTETVIGMLLDINLGTLSYYKDGVPLGVAFREINHEHYDLFPCVLGIHGTRMTLGRRFRSFNNLQDRCRATIMREIYNESDTDLLPIPTCTKRYLNDDYRLYRDPPKSERRQNVDPIFNIELHYVFFFILVVFVNVAYIFLEDILF